jgi:hypothetical protein
MFYKPSGTRPVIFIRLGIAKMDIIIRGGALFDSIVKNHEIHVCFSVLLGWTADSVVKAYVKHSGLTRLKIRSKNFDIFVT